MFEPDKPKPPTLGEVKRFHRFFAEHCTRECMELVCKADRIEPEIEHMVHLAHAARMHWAMVGEPVDFARADALLGYVHGLVGEGSRAMHYARSATAFVKQGGKGFRVMDEACAALAEAFAADLLGDTAHRATQMEKVAGALLRVDSTQEVFLLRQLAEQARLSLACD